MTRRVGHVLGALLAVGTIALVASGAATDWAAPVSLTLPGASEPHRVGLGRTNTVLVCPGAPELAEAGSTDEDFENGGVETRTRVDATSSTPDARLVGAVVSAPGRDGTVVAPEQIDVVDGEEVQSLTSSTPETATVVAVPSGNLAAELSALRTSLTESGDLRGLAASSCVTPSPRSYLVGGGVEPGRSAVVTLSNPGRTTAVVDLRVLTPEGPVEPASAQDVAVAPGTVRELLLEGLVPEQAVLAVEVVADGGSVAATMTDTQLDGVVPAGVEVVPAVPALTEAVIPGILAGSAEVTLRIAVPGSEPAVVGWQVEGPGGPVVPAGESVASVQGGQVVDVPIEGLGPGRVNLRVEADQPVGLSVEVVAGPSTSPTDATDTDGQARERAYAVPAPAVTDTAVLSVAKEPLRTNLVLSTAGTDARVTLRPVDARGRAGDPVDVPVEPGVAAVVPFDVLEDASAVRVEVGQGVVHVAQLVAASVEADSPEAGRSPLFSIVPVTVPESTQRTVRVARPEPGRWP